MSERLKALREKRGQVVTEMRGLISTAEKRDGQAMTAEESAKHTELFNKSDELRKQIEAEERTIEAERELATTQANVEEARAKKPGANDALLTPEARADALLMAGFRTFLSSGKLNGEGAQELRNLQAGSDAEGGYLIAPQQFVAMLIQAINNAVFVRAKAKVISVVKSESMGVPTLDTDLDDADWTSELAVGNTDDAMRFGKRELHPHPVGKLVKVSKKLVRISAMPIEAIVLAQLGYKFGVTQEKAFLTGDGAGKPLGLFVASADGVPTSRDYSTGNTTTAITMDGLIGAKYSLKAGYWPKSEWMFHRDAMAMVSKLKDSDGQYLWRPSVREGEPDRLLGHAINVSEYVPNTFTTGQYVGLFGDLSHYWIADALDMQVQTLIELYAATNQNGYIGRLETDGMPVLGEAFARVKLA